MRLKDFLCKIGIPSDNEDHVWQFLYQPEIENFLKQKWQEFEDQKAKNEVDKVESEDSVVSSTLSACADEQTPKEKLVEDEEQQPIQKEEHIIQNEEDKTEQDMIFPSDQSKEEAKNSAFTKFINNQPIVLQNGKVNQPYSYKVDMSFVETHEIGEYGFEGLEDLGLEFDKTENTIKGTPSKPGDYKVLFWCKRKDWEEGKPVFERPVTFVINPDPRSLWNNIPTPTNVAYYKPDSDKFFIPVKAKKSFLRRAEDRKDMVAASQRGRSHAHEGTPRDDDFSMAFLEESEWYIMSVADGAGSAKYSRRGSQIACQTVLEVCQSQLTKYTRGLEDLIKVFNEDNSEENRKKLGDAIYNIVGSAVFKAYKNIEKEATDSGSNIKDFSTTLIISVCKKFKFGWFVAAFWVGDGGIGIYNKDTRFLKILGEPDGGEFAGQTRFLTMGEVMQPTEIYRRLRFGIVDEFTALILMTDGITDPKFETDSNLSRIEKWDQLWDDLNKEVVFDENNTEIDNQLLKWLDFWSQGNHDDRTIAILF